jgi:RNA binding Region
MKASTPFENFSVLVSQVLSVSREEMQRRESAYRAQADANPKKRGPKKGSKRKPKQPSAVPGPASEPHA